MPRLRLRPWHALAALPVLALAVYGRVLGDGFLSDDFRLVWRVATGNWSFEQGGFFRPLIIALYHVDYWVWGLWPVGYHITNLTLHVVNALLVVAFGARLLRRVGVDEPRWPAIASGAVFLLLPSHSESVSWIAGRTDLLATSGMLLSLVAYFAWRQAHEQVQFLLSLTAFGCALLAKESAVMLPAVIVILEIVAGDRRRAWVPVVRSVRPRGRQRQQRRRFVEISRAANIDTERR